MTAFDLEVLQAVGAKSNSYKELLKIATPALLSLALCPATLYLYQPLVAMFWPRDKGFTAQPDINEAIACFLAPAGLVYATSFGFAFQQALTKQGELLNKITHAIGLLDQILSLTIYLSISSGGERAKIYQAIKSEAICLLLKIERADGSRFKHKPKSKIKGW